MDSIQKSQIKTALETILGKTITAYGTHGESFITEHSQAGNKYYHNNNINCRA